MLKVEFTAEVPLWDPSCPEFSRQEQCMFDYRGCFVSLTTVANRHLFINSVQLYAFDAADVTDNDNFFTVLERFVNTSSLTVHKLIPKMYQGSTIWFLPESGVFQSRKHLM